MRKIDVSVLPDGKDWFTLSEIAKIIDRHPSLLTILYKSGKFPKFDDRIGNKLVYKRETVIKFLENYEQYASNPSRFKGSKNGKRSSKKTYKQMDILEELKKNEPNSPGT